MKIVQLLRAYGSEIWRWLITPFVILLLLVFGFCFVIYALPVFFIILKARLIKRKKMTIPRGQCLHS